MLKGVISVVPGYAGGTDPAPTYEKVCSGKTGHAEVVQVEFDPSVISYKDLLTVFFATHDPTTPNRQGNDAGPQYRSIILTTNDGQQDAAESFIRKLDEGFGPKVVTEVRPLTGFFEAEKEHLDYYRNNRRAPYCEVVINPKLEKLRQRFSELMSE